MKMGIGFGVLVWILSLVAVACDDGASKAEDACSSYASKTMDCLDVDSDTQAMFDEVRSACEQTGTDDESLACCLACDRGADCAVWRGCVENCSIDTESGK